MDSDLDIGLLSPHGDTNDPALVTQIKNQGVAVDAKIIELITSRYHVNISKCTLLKNDNFVLLQEPERVRIFLIE